MLMQSLRSICRYVSCSLSLVHTALFEQQSLLRDTLWGMTLPWCDSSSFVSDFLGEWTSVYPGVIISGNQAIAPQLDEADPNAYHALLALGTHSGGFVRFPGLRAAFPFLPGALIFYAGASLEYSIDAAPSGERVVLRFYTSARLGRTVSRHRYMTQVTQLPTLKTVKDRLLGDGPRHQQVLCRSEHSFRLIFD